MKKTGLLTLLLVLLLVSLPVVADVNGAFNLWMEDFSETKIEVQEEVVCAVAGETVAEFSADIIRLQSHVLFVSNEAQVSDRWRDLLSVDPYVVNLAADVGIEADWLLRKTRRSDHPAFIGIA